jgi:hypothetical protein
MAGTPIGPNDTAIAGTRHRRGAVLVTNNTREFERVPGLVLEDWVNNAVKQNRRSGAAGHSFSQRYKGIKMPLITRLMLQNFKKFPELDLRFTHDRNILVGDNESGKSTILLALDLVLSDSRHRVGHWVWNRSVPVSSKAVSGR